MNIKIVFFLIPMLLTLIFLSGCIENSKPIEEELDTSQNLRPVGVILAPEKAYFGETIKYVTFGLEK